MERETRFELATFALARQRSTTEPLPQNDFLKNKITFASYFTTINLGIYLKLTIVMVGAIGLEPMTPCL